MDHSWIQEVLSDLATAAFRSGLTRTAEELKNTELMYLVETAQEGPETLEVGNRFPHLGCNVIQFPERRVARTSCQPPIGAP